MKQSIKLHRKSFHMSWRTRDDNIKACDLIQELKASSPAMCSRTLTKSWFDALILLFLLKKISKTNCSKKMKNLSKYLGYSRRKMKKEANKTLNALEHSHPRGITVLSITKLKEIGCSIVPVTTRNGCLWYVESFFSAKVEMHSFSYGKRKISVSIKQKITK